MFVSMATLIMRLKLFLTPQLALVTSALALPKVGAAAVKVSRHYFIFLLAR